MRLVERKLTKTVRSVVNDSAGKVLNTKSANIRWCHGFRLKKPAVMFVLKSNFLHVRFGRASGCALDIQHTQQPRSLQINSIIIIAVDRIWIAIGIESKVQKMKWGRCTERCPRNRVRVRIVFLPPGTIQCSIWRCACWKNAASSQRTDWCINVPTDSAENVYKKKINLKLERKEMEGAPSVSKYLWIFEAKHVENTNESVGGVANCSIEYGHRSARFRSCSTNRRGVLTGHFGLIVHWIVRVRAKRARHTESFKTIGTAYDRCYRTVVKCLGQCVPRTTPMKTRIIFFFFFFFFITIE